MIVDIFCAGGGSGERHLGYLYDSNGKVKASNPKEPGLMNIINEPVYDFNTGEEISPEKNPIEFLKALPNNFHSYSFNAQIRTKKKKVDLVNKLKEKK